MGAKNTIQVFISAVSDKFDDGLKGAKASLKNFGTSISEAEGVTGKFKAGATAAFDGVKANAANLALAGGAALVGFAVSSVGAFQDIALAAGEFADATGIGVEDASRWIEVAGDIGIESDAVEGAFLKMNKAIADGKPALKDYGVEIVKTKDGMVDSNATFQNAISTIGAIRDPTLRAKAAQEIFGKSYASIAELMEMSAGDLKDALESVGDAQLIDQEELDKAKKFRETMDNVSDALQGVQIAAGEAFVDVVGFIDDATRGAEELGRSVRTFFDQEAEDNWNRVDAFNASEDAAKNYDMTQLAGLNTFEEVHKKVLEQTGDMHQSNLVSLAWKKRLDDATGANDQLAETVRGSSGDLRKQKEAFEGVETATKAADRAYSSLLGIIDNKQAWLNLLDSVDDYNTKMKDSKATDREKEQSLLSVKSELIKYTQSLGDIPADKRTQVLALIDQGKISEAQWILGDLTKTRDVRINPVIGKGASGNFTITAGSKFASGTDSAPGGVALVGENGPEIVNLPQGSQVIPNWKSNQMRQSGASSNGGNVYITLPVGSDPRRAAEIARRYTRRTGRDFGGAI